MEFIGLLGLIGLVGFFYGKSLNQSFNNLKSEFRRLAGSTANVDSRINGNEKNIGDVKNDLQRLKGTLQNFATTDELDKNSRYLQNELREELQAALKKISSEQSNFQDVFSKIDELERKIPAPSANADLIGVQSALKNFQITVEKQRTDFDKRLKTLETRPISPPPTTPAAPANVFEGRIAALESDRQNLMNQLAQYQNFFRQIGANFDVIDKKLKAQEKIISDYDALTKKFETQEKIISDYDALTKKFEAQEKIISDYETRIKKLEGKISTPPIPSPPTSINIRDFQIKNRSGALFTKSSELATSLAAVENLSGIISSLKNAPADKKDSFNRIIKTYQQNLGKFIDKVKRGKFDEDTFSEEVSEKFFAVLSKYFLATIPVAIYRGRKENTKFYSDFLARINDYLAACHVYTELVEPKKIMTSKQIECMNIFKKDTSVRSEDKIIDEVEQLPYFMDYLDEDGNTERYCAEGKMILLKFNGGK